MTLLEIGAQYDEAAKALGQRIRELRTQHRATDDPDTAWHLQRRIEELIPLRKEARQLSNLCLHYYERSFWRSELYTFNDASQRVPGRPHRVAEKPGRDQRRSVGAITEKPHSGHPGRADAKTAGGIAAVLLRGLTDEGHCGAAEGKPLHRVKKSEGGAKEAL